VRTYVRNCLPLALPALLSPAAACHFSLCLFFRFLFCFLFGSAPLNKMFLFFYFSPQLLTPEPLPGELLNPAFLLAKPFPLMFFEPAQTSFPSSYVSFAVFAFSLPVSYGDFSSTFYTFTVRRDLFSLYLPESPPFFFPFEEFLPVKDKLSPFQIAKTPTSAVALSTPVFPDSFFFSLQGISLREGFFLVEKFHLSDKSSFFRILLAWFFFACLFCELGLSVALSSALPNYIPQDVCLPSKSLCFFWWCFRACNGVRRIAALYLAQ